MDVGENLQSVSVMCGKSSLIVTLQCTLNSTHCIADAWCFSCWRKCVHSAVTTATSVRSRRGKWTSNTSLTLRVTTTVRRLTTMTKTTTLPARTVKLRWNSPHQVLPTHSMWIPVCCTYLRAVCCYIVTSGMCFVSDLILWYRDFFWKVFP